MESSADSFSFFFFLPPTQIPQAREILLELEEIEVVTVEICIGFTPVVCVHSTLQRSLSPQLEVMFSLLPPHTSPPDGPRLGESLARPRERERVCNTARDTFHTLRVQGRARGDLAKEVRDV